MQGCNNYLIYKIATKKSIFKVICALCIKKLSDSVIFMKIKTILWKKKNIWEKKKNKAPQ